ncbi:hypothetical protein Golob_025339, partial [Gossypium lobatum]|nr:hypothetical protein [Gossypium lobatum]
MEADFNNMHQEVDVAEQRLLNPFYYKFGKNVTKMLQGINDHVSKGAFKKVVKSKPSASVVVRLEEQPISLEPTIAKVWSCIVDKDVGIIG